MFAEQAFACYVFPGEIPQGCEVQPDCSCRYPAGDWRNFSIDRDLISILVLFALLVIAIVQWQKVRKSKNKILTVIFAIILISLFLLILSIVVMRFF